MTYLKTPGSIFILMKIYIICTTSKVLPPTRKSTQIFIPLLMNNLNYRLDFG